MEKIIASASAVAETSAEGFEAETVAETSAGRFAAKTVVNSPASSAVPPTGVADATAPENRMDTEPTPVAPTAEETGVALSSAGCVSAEDSTSAEDSIPTEDSTSAEDALPNGDTTLVDLATLPADPATLERLVEERVAARTAEVEATLRAAADAEVATRIAVAEAAIRADADKRVETAVAEAVSAAVKDSEERLLSHLRLYGTRPIENGTSGEGGIHMQAAVERLTRHERALLARRAQNGEFVTL